MIPLAGLLAGASFGGSLLSGLGSIIGGNARANAAEYAAEASREGAYFRAAASEQGGLFAEQEAEFTARQLEGAGAESLASAQREAFEKRRVAKLAMSSLVARAAASGGSATSTDVLDIGEGIAQRGEYQALMDMFTGQNRQRGLQDQAMAARVSGAAKKWGLEVDAVGSRYAGDTGLTAARYGASAERTAGYLSGAGTILSGVGSAFRGLAPRVPSYG